MKLTKAVLLRRVRDEREPKLIDLIREAFGSLDDLETERIK